MAENKHNPENKDCELTQCMIPDCCDSPCTCPQLQAEAERQVGEEWREAVEREMQKLLGKKKPPEGGQS